MTMIFIHSPVHSPSTLDQPSIKITTMNGPRSGLSQGHNLNYLLSDCSYDLGVASRANDNRRPRCAVENLRPAPAEKKHYARRRRVGSNHTPLW